MREFERKKKVKKIMYSRTIIFSLFVLLLFFIHATYGVYKKERITRNSLRQVENEKLNLDNRYHTLEKSVAYLQTDEGVEAEIRNKFRAVKPGEQVAIIVNTEVKKEVAVPKDRSFWMKIKDFFGIL